MGGGGTKCTGKFTGLPHLSHPRPLLALHEHLALTESQNHVIRMLRTKISANKTPTTLLIAKRKPLIRLNNSWLQIKWDARRNDQIMNAIRIHFSSLYTTITRLGLLHMCIRSKYTWEIIVLPGEMMNGRRTRIRI